MLQIWGVQDLFVFDHGSFFSDSNSSLGRHTAPGQYSLQSLHVQDRGVFELHSSDKDLTSVLSLFNLTVSLLYLKVIINYTTKPSGVLVLVIQQRVLLVCNNASHGTICLN